MLVVDASFVVPILVDETYSEFAHQVMRATGAEPLAAPTLLHWEVANVLWKKLIRSELDETQAIEAGVIFERLAIELSPPTEQVELLAQAGVDNGLTAYDAAYLALAVRERAPLATTDEDLAQAARRCGLVVHAPFA